MHVEKCLAIFMCMFSVHVMSHQICLHVCKRMYMCKRMYIYMSCLNHTKSHDHSPCTIYKKNIVQSTISPYHKHQETTTTHTNYTHHIYIYTYISHYPLFHPSTMFPNKIPPRFCIRSGKGGEGEIHTERTR